MAIDIREGHLEDVITLLQDIPEFENIPDHDRITRRLKRAPHLVLTAYHGEEIAGFKIGYERDQKFYSWLGAVRVSHRQGGVANLLADHQEQWARQQGYQRIWMKTRNCFPAMLIMAHRRGFRITRIEPWRDLAQNRIILEKAL